MINEICRILYNCIKIIKILIGTWFFKPNFG